MAALATKLAVVIPQPRQRSTKLHDNQPEQHQQQQQKQQPTSLIILAITQKPQPLITIVAIAAFIANASTGHSRDGRADGVQWESYHR
jgi:hypothetical protein